MKILLVFLFLIACSFARTQSAIYNAHAPNGDFIRPLCQDIEAIPGGYLVTGIAAAQSRICWVSRTDEQFEVVWTKSFEVVGDTAFMDYGTTTYNNRIIITEDDHFVLIAKSKLGSLHYTAMLGMDLQNGDVSWSKQLTDHFPHPNDFDLEDTKRFSNGDLMVCRGSSAGTYVCRMTPSGITVNSKLLTNSVNDPAGAADISIYSYVCANDDLLVLQMHDHEMIAMRLTENYIPLWTKRYTHTELTLTGRSVTELPDGELLITGNTMDSLEIDFCPFIKLSPQGDLLSLRSFSSDFIANQLLPLGGSNFLLHGIGSAFGILDLSTGDAAFTNVNYLQANHSFFMKITGGNYIMQGLGLNWEESKIGVFSSLETLACLDVTHETKQLQDRNTNEISVTDIQTIVMDYDLPSNFTPVWANMQTSFEEECYLAVEDNDLLSFSLYPNPVLGSVIINLADASQAHHFTLTDAKGKVWQQGFLIGNSCQLETGAIAAGIYFVTLITEDGGQTHVQKLIVE